MPSLVELGPVILEKKIFKRSRFIFIISQSSPLWKGRGPSFEQTWIPFTQGCSVPSLVEIGPVVLEKKIFKVVNLFLLFPNHLPFGKDVALRKVHLSFQLRWAKNICLITKKMFLSIWIEESILSIIKIPCCLDHAQYYRTFHGCIDRSQYPVHF